MLRLKLSMCTTPFPHGSGITMEDETERLEEPGSVNDCNKIGFPATEQWHIWTHNDCDNVHKSKLDRNSSMKGKGLMTSHP